MFRVIIMFCAMFTVSIADVIAADIKGSSDHPVVGRFVGSEIIGYDVKKYDEFLFPEGPVVTKDNKKILSRSSVLEGKITRILYVSPEGRSSLEVYKNYERSLKKSGFEEVYSCKSKDGSGCGYYLLDQPTFQPPLVEYAYKGRDYRYVSMKKSSPEGDVYASLMVYIYNFDFFRSRYGRAMVQLDVIEIAPLDDAQMEVITAESISKEISEQGRIALYGIYFDTDKAEIKPASDAALAEIVKALKSDGKLKLHVVGHTDNTGSFNYNMVLSKRRANAVVAALIARGIDAGRLTPNGVSSLAPVASNTSEEGRVKNRRVELVAQ